MTEHDPATVCRLARLAVERDVEAFTALPQPVIAPVVAAEMPDFDRRFTEAAGLVGAVVEAIDQGKITVTITWPADTERAKREAGLFASAVAERDEARRIAADITRGATRLHDILRVTHGSVQKLIDPQRHTPDRVCRYLEQQGWTRLRETATGTDWTWGTPITQWAAVPGSTHYTDYARRIAFVAVDAADVHGTGELRVLADIEGIDGDPLPDWLTAADATGPTDGSET